MVPEIQALKSEITPFLRSCHVTVSQKIHYIVHSMNFQFAAHLIRAASLKPIAHLGARALCLQSRYTHKK